jgi:hypothetical protein
MHSSYNIPIHLVILRGANGSLIVDEWGSVRQLLPAVNNYFQGRLNFYISSTTVLENAAWLGIQIDGTEDIDLYNAEHGNNAINIYLVEKAFTGFFPNQLFYGSYSKYPTSWFPGCPNDNLIILSASALASQSRMEIELARSLGKYFGLLSTNQVSGFASCDLFNPLVDDPALTGDLIADTPFEPQNILCSPPVGCDDFTCTLDCPPNQQFTYTFQPSNMMSRYYFQCSNPHFTDEQLDRMCFFLNHDRSYLLTPEPTLPGPFGEQGRISRICGGSNEEPARLREVRVYFDQNQQADPGFSNTNIDGYYQLHGRLSNDHNQATSRPVKAGDPLNGIDILDLLKLKDHLLNIDNLLPFEMIAADVNYSGSVTPFDMVELRKLLLEEVSSFRPSVGEWRYIPKMPFATDPLFEANFMDNNPFDAAWVDPQGITEIYVDPSGNFLGGNPPPNAKSFMDEIDVVFSNPGYDLDSEDTWSFYVVKAGDLDCSASFQEFTGGGGDEANEYEPTLNVGSLGQFNSADYIDVAVWGSSPGDIEGYQLNLNFDPTKVEILSVESGDLPYFSFDNFNIEKFPLGKLRAVWFNPVANTAYNLQQPKKLFKIKLRAKTAISNISDYISLGDEIWSVFYDNTENPISSQITLQASLSNLTSHKVLSILPSPMTNVVQFNLNLFQAAPVYLNLTDQFGHTISSQQNLLTGNQSIAINNLQTLVNGVVFYNLNIGNQIFTGTLMKYSE